MVSTTTVPSAPVFVAGYQCNPTAMADLKLAGLAYVKSIRVVSKPGSLTDPLAEFEGIVVEFYHRAGFDADQRIVLDELRKKDPSVRLVWCGLENNTIERPEPSVPWYHQVSKWWAIVTGLIGAFGIIEVSRNHWLELFEPPAIVSMSSNETVDVLGQDPWKLDFELKSVTRGIDCYAQLRKIEITKPDRTTWEPDSIAEEIFPAIKSGSHETWTLESANLPDQIQMEIAKRPGKYLFTIQGISRGGYLRCSRRFQIHRSLQVWAATSIESPQLLALKTPTSDIASLQIPIRVGKSNPNGQTSQITMYGCRIVGLQTSKTLVNRPETLYTASVPSTSTVTWRTTKSGPYEKYIVTLALKSEQPLDKVGWDTLLKQANLTYDTKE